MYEDYSVLMSVYKKDNPKFLRQSIESILGQTKATNDYVIVQDGPLTEELEYVLQEYEARIKCINLIKRKQNRGLGATLNVGLRFCKNSLVARMDADDISLPNRCEVELDIFNTDESVGIVGAPIIRFSGDESNSHGVKRMPVSPEEIYEYGKWRNPFNHPTVMYKKNIVLKYGGYSETIRGEDFALFTKMIADGVVGKNCVQPLLLYRSDENQYKRRTSWHETKVVLNIVYRNYKLGYAGLSDYAKAIILQMGGCILPNRLGEFVYQKLLRNY